MQIPTKASRKMYYQSIAIIALLFLGNSFTSSAQLYTWYQDNDGDGFGNNANTQSAILKPVGYVANNIDCNDNAFNPVDWQSVGNNASSNQGTHSVLKVDNNGILYLAFRDAGNGNKITVRKYDGSTWATVGTAGISSGVGNYISLAIDGNNSPYVAYSDASIGDKIIVKKFDGTTWINVGAAGISTGAASYNSLAIDGSNAPYIAFSDAGASNNAVVMKYNGSTWTDLNLPSVLASDYSIAIDKTNNNILLAYINLTMGSRATVMKFDGTWSTLGITDISTIGAEDLTLVIDRYNTPHIAFRDYGNAQKPSVKKYDGTDWVDIGNAGFYANGTDHVTMDVDPAGVPYVSFRDATLDKMIITKFDGTAWQVVSPSNATTSGTSYNSMSMYKGIPYVAYIGNNNLPAVLTIKPILNIATTPMASATATTIMKGGSTTLSVATGTLNDATQWTWYETGCGSGTAIGTGTSITVSPSASTTYYVRGEGICVPAGQCSNVAIMVNTTNVNEITTAKNENIKLYPSSANSVVYVETSDKLSRSATIRVTDMAGRELRVIPVNSNKTEINIAELVPGMYIAGYYQEGAKVTTLRFIKN